jgi:cytochrome b561
MEQETIRYYSPQTRVLHWLTAIVVMLAFIYSPGGSEMQVYAAARDFERQLHETLGLLVLALVALRLLWRCLDRRTEPPLVAGWMAPMARAVQVMLYVLLFAVPITAISGAWLEGHALTFLGGLAIPPPFAESHALGSLLANVHTWLGDAIIWFAGAHAVAGLLHHYVLKDHVLRSMLPKWNTKSA